MKGTARTTAWRQGSSSPPPSKPRAHGRHLPPACTPTPLETLHSHEANGACSVVLRPAVGAPGADPLCAEGEWEAVHVRATNQGCTVSAEQVTHVMDVAVAAARLAGDGTASDPTLRATAQCVRVSPEYDLFLVEAEWGRFYGERWMQTDGTMWHAVVGWEEAGSLMLDSMRKALDRQLAAYIEANLACRGRGSATD